MLNEKLVLNGKWMADYLVTTPNEKDIEIKYDRSIVVPYNSEVEPELSADKVRCPVPGYWEDNLELFRTTGIHTKVKYNPLYTLQRYPQASYVPDMALPNIVGSFVYKRSFKLSEVCENAELWLGGVQNTAAAWINGVYLGRHEGYSSDFTFAIPADVLEVGENRITLVVSNIRLKGYAERPVSGLTSRAANECTGGIYGDVELRFHKDGLRDVWVTTAEDVSAFTVNTDGGKDAEKTVTIYDGKKRVASAVIPAGETAVTIAAEGFALWSPESPKLYKAVVETANQKMENRFGIRRLAAKGTKLYLNNKPYFFCGICEHCYHPITVHPTRDKNYYRRVLRILKELGFNSIRFHTYVPMVEYMEAADELGMIMEIETPNNTHYEEWKDIVRMTRRYTAPVMYSSGNEMTINPNYVEHLRKCAELVHAETDALFSPMSALRSIEYAFKPEDELVDEPFPYSPKRLADVAAFSDVYNSYSLSQTSYTTDIGNPKVIDKRNAVFQKPVLSHEICIHGTYVDLSLKDRYKGSRIGETELFTSVERHLADKGLLDRANTYYRNSAKWQILQRKHCFEVVRRNESFAGYDFLGDIDTHWHTFGYCVGMMNEFYELKAGETVQNVRRYNSETVLLTDLPRCRNFAAGEKLDVPVLVSNYKEDMDKAVLTLRVADDSKVYQRRTLHLSDIKAGEITKLYTLSFNMPKVEEPTRIKICATIAGGNVDAENEWELYVFPKAKKLSKPRNLTVAENMSAEELIKAMKDGKNVLLLSAGPFPNRQIDFQLSVAGRTNGHLATVIADHPLMRELPNDGFCGWQFREMMNGGQSVILDNPDLPYAPIIEMASSYKNARPEALVFEYRIGNGKLLVSALDLKENDPGACWLKEKMTAYAASDEFEPECSVSVETVASWFNDDNGIYEGNNFDGRYVNDNVAANKNDITMD